MTPQLGALAQIQTAVTFRANAPQEDPDGNARALAIRNLVSSEPLHWADLPRIALEQKYLAYCLHAGDVVIPSRGDYYRAWLFTGAEERVFPLGQLNVIRSGPSLDARYLVWYLNKQSTQAKILPMLTGTSIKALTKSTLSTLGVELPSLQKQRQIAELDQTTQQIIALRLRLNELDRREIAHLTAAMLREGGGDA